MIKNLVSIIIPFFNRINEVEIALDSAINQTYLNKEIILINDGSSDSIEKIKYIANKNDNIFLVNNKKNFGVSYSRNLGIEFARGEFIAFLDSDDEWMNYKIQQQMDFILKHNLQFTYTAYKRKYKNYKNFKTINIPNQYSMPFMAFSCKIATPTVLFKKDLSKDLKFNEDINYGEDIIYWAKISKKTKLIGINSPTTIVNVSENSTSQLIHKQKLGFSNINKELFQRNLILSFLHRIYYNSILLIKTLSKSK